jgi:hypothetical protein
VALRRRRVYKATVREAVKCARGSAVKTRARAREVAGSSPQIAQGFLPSDKRLLKTFVWTVIMIMTNAITYLRNVKTIQSCALKTASHVEGYALRAPPNLFQDKL